MDLDEYDDTLPRTRSGTGRRKQVKELAATFACYFIGGFLLSGRFFASLVLGGAMCLISLANYGRDWVTFFGIGLLLAGLIRYLSLWPS